MSAQERSGRPGDRSQEKLVRVFVAQDELEARMIQELLHNSQIESLINAETAPGLFPASFGELGRHEILVTESCADQARELLRSIRGTESELE